MNAMTLTQTNRAALETWIARLKQAEETAPKALGPGDEQFAEMQARLHRSFGATADLSIFTPQDYAAMYLRDVLIPAIPDRPFEWPAWATKGQVFVEREDDGHIAVFTWTATEQRGEMECLLVSQVQINVDTLKVHDSDEEAFISHPDLENQVSIPLHLFDQVIDSLTFAQTAMGGAR